jgi:hypothetical protein
MNPKETAQYLVNKYSIIPINNGFTYNDMIELRKECALITAYEVHGQYQIEHDAPLFLFWENVIKQIKLL